MSETQLKGELLINTVKLFSASDFNGSKFESQTFRSIGDGLVTAHQTGRQNLLMLIPLRLYSSWGGHFFP